MIDAAYSIRHNLWATRELLEHARSLSPEQLELSVAGTAGGIMFSLAHIVGADQRYLVGLGSVVEVPIRPAADVSLAEIILAHASNEVAWERLLENPPALATWFERADRHDRVRLVMLPAQAIHHGTDHRIQIGTILLHHGLELPDLDVWTYAAQMGDYQRLES